MTDATITPEKKSPKLDQFLSELNDLCKKYQYSLNPVLKVAQEGIVPILTVKDVVPPKKKEAKK